MLELIMENEQEIYGYIYLIRNKINNKKYIGQTTNEKGFRWDGIKTDFYNDHFNKAVKKYGTENFEQMVIDKAYDSEVLNFSEQFWILFYKSYDSLFGYNKTFGGEVGKWTEETKRKIGDLRKGENNPMYGKHHTKEVRNKISKAHKGMKASEETRKKMSDLRKGEKHPMYGKEGWNKGKHFSKEHRKKIGESNKGRISPMKGKKMSEEQKKKISESMKGENNPMYGKKHSEETRKKMRKINKGENNPFYGKKHTEETRKKMSKARKLYLEKKRMENK